MTDLPELPPPSGSIEIDSGTSHKDPQISTEDGFTANDMRSYALEAVRVERERLAQMVETMPLESFASPGYIAQTKKLRIDIAAAIRKG
jgi:hypothetical protein